MSFLGFSLPRWLNESGFPAGSVLAPWIVEHIKRDLELSPLIMNPSCVRDSGSVELNNWNSSCKILLNFHEIIYGFLLGLSVCIAFDAWILDTESM